MSTPADHGASHVPVLMKEALAALAPIAGGDFVDGTFGAGGYTRAIFEAGARKVVSIDRDPGAIAAGAALSKAYGPRLVLVHGRFSELDRHAAEAGVDRADGVVLDIGVSSMQLDQAERGFSFRGDGPLDMRMGGEGASAADIVNQLDAPELARILQLFGEERQAGRIARAIVRRRTEGPITRTSELVAVCESVLGPKRFGEAHPATRTFQALRIHVNGELDELVAALAAAERLLSPGGRLAVVTFHSLEDRIVKRFFADRSRTIAQGSRHRPEESVPPPTFTDVAKPAEPTAAECERNPRARSARLRHGVRTAADPRDIDPAGLGAPVLDVVHRRRRKSP